MEISEAPSPAKRSKAGKVTKKRKPKSSLQLINEGVDEGVPDKEPLFGDEERFRVRGKRKSGLNKLRKFYSTFRLQKKSPADQYIFQRRTSTQTKPTGHDESSFPVFAELGLDKLCDIDEASLDQTIDDAEASQPPSSHVVHAGPNREHMDLEASDTSIQPNPEPK
ncbi:hypothetical protein Tco_0517445 [Tanacetum coccineum]